MKIIVLFALLAFTACSRFESATDPANSSAEMSSYANNTFAGPTLLKINMYTDASIDIKGTCTAATHDINITGFKSMGVKCVKGQWIFSSARDSFPEGPSTLLLSQSDGSKIVLQVKKDTIPPVAALSGLPKAYSNLKNFSFAVTTSDAVLYKSAFVNGASADCSKVTYSDQIDVKTPIALDLSDSTKYPDGAYTICTVARDAMENWQEPTKATMFSWVKDTTPPVLKADANVLVNMYSPAKLTFKGQCSEKGMPVKITGGYSGSVNCGADGNFSVDIDSSVFPEGNSVLNYTQTDLAENTTTITTKIFKDTIPPTAVLSGLPAAYSNAPSVSINVTTSDAVLYKYAFGMVGKVDCTKDSSYGTEMDLKAPIAFAFTDKTKYPDGKYLLCVVARDASLNWQTSANSTQFSWTVDTTPPVLKVTSPLAINMYTPTMMSITGQCSENGQPVTIAGPYTGAPICSGGSFTATFARDTLPEGASTLTFTQTDMSTNKTTVSMSISKDTIPPTSTLAGAPTHPLADPSIVYTVGGTDVIAYRSALGTSVATCANISNYGTETPVANKLSLDLSALADGPVYVCAIGRDAAGNWQSLDKVTTSMFTRDSKPPVLTAPSVLAITSASPDPILVKGTCSVEGLAINVAYGTKTTVVNCASNAWTLSLAKSSFTDGTYKMTFTTTKTNLLSASASMNVIVDQTPPVVTLTGAPTDTNKVMKLNITVSSQSGEAVAYKYKVVAGPAAMCADSSGYSTEQPISTAITTDISNSGTYPDGVISVCAVGRDSAGNYQPFLSATSASWKRDSGMPMLMVQFDKNYYDPTVAVGTYLDVPGSTEEPLYIGMVHVGDVVPRQLKIHISHNQKTDVALSSVLLPAKMTLAAAAPAVIPSGAGIDLLVQMDQSAQATLAGNMTITTGIASKSFAIQGDILP